MPRLPGPALARRVPEGRGQAIPMPILREEALGHLRDLAFRLQAHAREDKVDRRHGDARVAGLGGRLSLPGRRENRPVLEGQMPRRRRGPPGSWTACGRHTPGGYPRTPTWRRPSTPPAMASARSTESSGRRSGARCRDAWKAGSPKGPGLPTTARSATTRRSRSCRSATTG